MDIVFPFSKSGYVTKIRRGNGSFGIDPQIAEGFGSTPRESEYDARINYGIYKQNKSYISRKRAEKRGRTYGFGYSDSSFKDSLIGWAVVIALGAFGPCVKYCSNSCNEMIERDKASYLEEIRNSSLTKEEERRARQFSYDYTKRLYERTGGW